ncbi:FAST kinase domain-containing protein 2, mitochondrial-like [Asterias rubens]|uniref:FAST kinase domain-containing protein 2, mitochondrial-like n=1 Tax=Asterias rubens TaxID=7604 RepID=UPI00145509A7|nr:FAST kinase domain-containing protein 2, mitochondrial-like [Asterias rubens]
MFATKNSIMLTRTARHMLKKWETSSFAISRAKPSGTNEFPGISFETLERSYGSQAWHHPVGKAHTPRTVKAQPRSSEIVPIEKIVDGRSLRVLEELHDAFSTSAVFQAVRELGGDLTEVHAAQAIIKLSQIQNQMATSMEDDQGNSTQLVKVTEENRLSVHRDKEFVKLCQLTLRHARALDSNSLVNVLKAVVDLGIPQSSMMIQTLLVNAEHRLNSLNCDELAMLASKLNKMQQNDQRVTALLQAIALLVPTRIDTCANVTSLNTLLYTTGQHLDKRTLSQMAIRSIAILKAKAETDPQAVVRDTTNTMFALESIGYHNPEFLREACEILTAYIEHLPPDMLRRVLDSLPSWQCYSPRLLEKAGDLIADSINEWSFNDLSKILASYSVQRFLHKNLLNKLATSVCERSLEGVKFGTLIKLVTPFAKFHHTPTDIGVFDLVEDAAECELEESQRDDLGVVYRQLVRLTELLAQCGSFPPSLVTRALSRRSFESGEATSHLHFLRTMIQLDRPELLPPGGHSPSDRDHPIHLSHPLGAADHASEDANAEGIRKLKVSLAEVFKDVTQNTQRCLATDVTVGHGYTVDVLITATKQEEQTIAIDLTRHAQYCANFPERPLGREIIKKRHLEALGYTFHMVHCTEWASLETHKDRTEFVKQILGVMP